jgi:hypothetical protein
MLQKNPWLSVCKRTIPAERPPLVGEVSANFYGLRVSHGQRNGSPRPLNSVFYTGIYMLQYLKLFHVPYYHVFPVNYSVAIIRCCIVG